MKPKESETKDKGQFIVRDPIHDFTIINIIMREEDCIHIGPRPLPFHLTFTITSQVSRHPFVFFLDNLYGPLFFQKVLIYSRHNTELTHPSLRLFLEVTFLYHLSVRNVMSLIRHLES